MHRTTTTHGCLRTPFARKALVVHTLLAVSLIGLGARVSFAQSATRTATQQATTQDATTPEAAAQTSTAQPANSGVNTDAAPKSAADANVQQLPEVTVTGQKTNGFAPATVETGPYKGLDPLDVPATVNVVTRSLMDAQGDTGLYDALRNVAGVTRQQLSGLAYDNLAIRGIPLDNRASYYFNGVLPIDNNIWMPMEDKERVEVLKAASALYYGFAAPAGIVNMVTKQAGPDPVTSLSLLGDSNGSYGAAVDIGRRFGADNQFGLRVNAMDEHVETPIDNDHGYRKFISAAFDWRVNSRLKLQYDMEHIETSIVEQAGLTPLAANKNGVIVLPAIPDPSKLLSGQNYPTRASADTNLFRLDYALSDNWSVNASVGESITRRDRWNWVFQKYNVTTGAGTVQATQQNGQRYQNEIVRIETNGVFKTGPISHDLTLGVSQDWMYQPNFTSYTYTAAQNLYNPVDIETLKPSGTSKPFYAQHVKNGGAYIYDRIELTPQLQFIPGVRQSEYSTSQAGTPNSDISKTTPSASLVYRITPNTSVYASYVEALESAGSAPSTAENAYAILPAVVSKQEEIGIRTQLSSGVLASLALFNLRQPSADTNDDNVYVLDGTARYRGIEFSLQGDVTKDLSLTGSVVYLDAKQVAASDPTLLGKVPENAAHVTANVFANYRVAFVPGLSVNGGVYYIGPRAVNDANQAWIGGYTLYTAGLQYTTKILGKRATFQANLENASNKRYWSSVGSSQIGVGLGRTLELTSTFDF
ncbi:iron complex outermembrane recepter protein [Pararobbsia alpina]|uniref:TonB-dependent siderophore receptor n=1 Tax=Pararobbsia alpina TaxID=621374 RepID=UPI0039A7087D